MGWCKARMIELLARLAYRRTLPRSVDKEIIARLWDEAAGGIQELWGGDHSDYDTLRSVIGEHEVKSVLDVGCGSGRLFPLYEDMGLGDVVGVDISKEALRLASEEFPTVRTIRSSIEDIEFPAGRFDLAISNSSLQHVPAHHIDEAVRLLTRSSRLVYVKELTNSNPQPEEYFMRKHNYPKIFERHEKSILKSGVEDGFTWYLFGIDEPIELRD